jgi:hypothetical protein
MRNPGSFTRRQLVCDNTTQDYRSIAAYRVEELHLVHDRKNNLKENRMIGPVVRIVEKV